MTEALADLEAQIYAWQEKAFPNRASWSIDYQVHEQSDYLRLFTRRLPAARIGSEEERWAAERVVEAAAKLTMLLMALVGKVAEETDHPYTLTDAIRQQHFINSSNYPPPGN